MNSFVTVAGWTLIHFLWQGAAVALATAVALRAARGRAAQVRYLIACAGLAAALALPAATAALLLPSGPAAASVGVDDAAARASPSPSRALATDAGATIVARVASLNTMAVDAAGRSGIRADDLIRGVVFVWVIGVALLLGRMAAGWWQVRELRRLALATPASAWQRACVRISERLGLARIVHVVESAVVEVPTVIGWLRPVIILPVAAIVSLTPSQVEAILAHELAHIRRYDYLVNLCQTLAETLLFYHPAVWWMSSRIRVEREHCCDEIAVTICGDPIAYAEALAELESWRTASTMIALAATGGSLIDRVRRILRVPPAEDARSSSWVATLALTLLFTAGAGGVQRLPAIFSGVTARAAAAVSGSSGSTDAVGAQASPALAAPRAARAHSEIARADADVARADAEIARAGAEIARANAEIVGLRAPAPPDVPALLEPTDQVAVPAPPAPPAPPTSPASLTPPVPPAPPTPASVTAPAAPPAPPTPPSAATSKAAHLDAAGVLPILQKVQQRMTSDFDRRQVLAAIAGATTLDARGAAVYMTIIGAMHSDFEKRQALSAVLSTKPLPAGVADLALAATAGMHSDFDRRQVLHAALVSGASADHDDALLPALASMRSSFDKREVLVDLIRTGSLTTEAQRGVLRTAAGVGSDFDKRTVLTAFVRQYGLDDSTRDAYFDAMKTIQSDFDRAESLLLLARSTAVDPSMRSAFVDAAQGLRSTHDQDRVLAALVRSERAAK